MISRRPLPRPSQAASTGGSAGSEFSSRNPYGTPADKHVSRNPYFTPQEQGPTTHSPSANWFTTPSPAAHPLENFPPDQTIRMSPPPERPALAAAPLLRTKPAAYQPPTSPPPSSPPRPTGQGAAWQRQRQQPHEHQPSASQQHETHPDFAPPFQPDTDADADNDDDNDAISDHTGQQTFAPRNSSLDPVGRPPRCHLTTGDIPVNTITYARHPTRLVAYLLPLPAPMRQGRRHDVPQRYMLYTPPAPHLLKPGAGEPKESKRHRVKRIAQEQIRKAKTYEGKMVSLRGLHSKILRGVDWAVGAIKSTDMACFSCVPRRAVDELVLIMPPPPPTAPLPVPTRRRLRRGMLRGGDEDGGSPARSTLDDVGILRLNGMPPRRSGSRTVRFQEDLGEGDANENEKVEEGEKGARKKKKTLQVRFVPDDAMETMDLYFRQILHRRNPRAFPTTGVPPTKTDVLASIGWWPDRRGRFPGSQQDGDWDDENWQTRQVKEDLDKVMAKAAKQWDKWCQDYAKYSERAMKKKGHSRTFGVLKRLHIKKSTPT